MSTTFAEPNSGTPTQPGTRAPHQLELIHPKTGHVVKIPLGYHWPVALLGPVPLAMQRNWKLAALTTIATVCLPVVGQLVMAKFASRLHAKHLLQKGYRGRGQQPGDVSAAEWALGITIPRLRSQSA